MILYNLSYSSASGQSTKLIGREDARKSGRCITRFAVGNFKWLDAVTITAGQAVNCNLI